RRREYTERSWFGDRGHEHSFAFVGDWLDGSHILNTTKEIRLLNDNRFGCRADSSIQIFDRSHTIACGYFFNSETACKRIRVKHTTILWIDACRDHHFAASARANSQ